MELGSSGVNRPSHLPLEEPAQIRRRRCPSGNKVGATRSQGFVCTRARHKHRSFSAGAVDRPVPPKGVWPHACPLFVGGSQSTVTGSQRPTDALDSDRLGPGGEVRSPWLSTFTSERCGRAHGLGSVAASGHPPECPLVTPPAPLRCPNSVVCLSVPPPWPTTQRPSGRRSSPRPQTTWR